jgi:DNA-binding NtrC family response regulator
LVSTPLRVLAAWIGNADLRGATAGDERDTGPIAQAIAARQFDRLLLICNQDPKPVELFVRWLKGRTTAEIDLESVSLTSPTDFGEIHRAAVAALEGLRKRWGTSAQLTIHLSPGTPTMYAVWVLLGKTRFPAEFLESSKQAGVKTVDVPFDISAELLPTLFGGPDQRLVERSAEVSSERAQFGDIIYRSTAMRRLVSRARKAAARSIPVLIEGESGTGKELLAKAIVNASPRSDQPFKVVNCGAIPAELVESELFGHIKGAFTGASKDRSGYFEQANAGTLFLDEIGELPLAAQVKLLRVLQEGEVTRVGSSDMLKVDVRVIAATNRNLWEEVAAGRFREDLFFRLAVLVLKVPALRERQGELGILIEALLKRVNGESASDPGFTEKMLSVGAKRLLLDQSWPGNVRELQNTLRRAAVWTDGRTISERDIREALLPEMSRKSEDLALLGPLGDGVDLQEIMSRVARHYLRAAMNATGGNKRKAARLLKLASHQRLTNWLHKYIDTDATRSSEPRDG